MNTLKKIVHVALTMVLVLATMGISVHKHYCMGTLMDVAVLHKAQTCQDEMGMNSGMECCLDTIDEFKVGDLTKVVHKYDLTPHLTQLAVIHLALLNYGLLSDHSHQSTYLNFKPPLIDRDIPVLTQSFLL